MKQHVIAVWGKPIVGKTTLMLTLGEWLQTNRMASVLTENVTRPGDKPAWLMTVSTDALALKFVWFRGPEWEMEVALKWTLQDVAAVIYVFNSSWGFNNEAYQECWKVAASDSKLPPKVPWMYVLNHWDTHLRHVPIVLPDPEPDDINSRIVTVNAKTGRGFAVLWREILRMAEKL